MACFFVHRGDLNGPIVEAAKAESNDEDEPMDEDKNASFDDKEVNDDLNNLLNQVCSFT